ncbi:MAG: hypothetical protein WA199_05700, partial [Xanthobacteraceae bacterium]
NGAWRLPDRDARSVTRACDMTAVGLGRAVTARRQRRRVSGKTDIKHIEDRAGDRLAIELRHGRHDGHLRRVRKVLR